TRDTKKATVKAADPTEKNHDDQFTCPLPRHISRTDEFRCVGEQEAGKSGDCTGDYVTDALKAKDIKAEGGYPRRVFARATKDPPEARIHNGAKQEIGNKQAE